MFFLFLSCLLLQQVEQHPNVAYDPKKPHPILHGSGVALLAVGFLVVSELMVTYFRGAASFFLFAFRIYVGEAHRS
jgi:hypothetical protein